MTNTSYIWGCYHMYIEGPHPVYISYVSPEQTRQDRYQETLEAAREARDKGQRVSTICYMLAVHSLIIHWSFQIVIKSVKICKDMTNTTYIWGCYHTITNHTIYINRGANDILCQGQTHIANILLNIKFNQMLKCPN